MFFLSLIWTVLNNAVNFCLTGIIIINNFSSLNFWNSNRGQVFTVKPCFLTHSLVSLLLSSSLCSTTNLIYSPDELPTLPLCWTHSAIWPSPIFPVIWSWLMDYALTELPNCSDVQLRLINLFVQCIFFSEDNHSVPLWPNVYACV